MRCDIEFQRIRKLALDELHAVGEPGWWSLTFNIYLCYNFKCKGLREWAIKILNLYKNRVKIRVEAPGICSIRKDSRGVIRVSTGFTMAAYSKIKEFIKIQEFYFQVRRVRSSGLFHPKRGRKWKPGGPQQNLHHGRLLSLRDSRW